MPFYRSGYDTTIGIGMVTKQIEHAIKESFIKDMLYNRHLDLITSQNYRPVFVSGAMASESNIPFFEHPLVIDGYKGMNFLCTDIRSTVRNSDSLAINEVSVRNQTEYMFAVHRTILNMAWLDDQVNQIKLGFNFAGTAYAAWLSDTIGKRFALDPKDRMIVSIISHFFYQSLFYPEDKFEEDMLQKFAVHTIKATNAPSQLVFTVFDQLPAMRGIEDYCQALKTVTGNIRLDDLNPGLLITMIGMTWYSANAKELLAVALEHPPTWITIVQTALVERGYRNSVVAKICEHFGKRGASSEFMANFVNLVKSYQETGESSLTFRAFDD